jgi:arginine repressor
MKKSTFVLGVIVLLLVSCKTYYFENPQPSHTKELKSFPNELIGTYFELKADTIAHVNEDPFVISKDSYHYKTNDSAIKDMKKDGSIEHGKVVLKKFHKYYVLSQKIENPLENSADSIWEVYVMKYKDERLVIYSMIYSEDNGSDKKLESKLLSDSIRAILPVIEKKAGNDTLFLINPSKNQFKKLLEKNLFRKVLEFKKEK